MPPVNGFFLEPELVTDIPLSMRRMPQTTSQIISHPRNDAAVYFHLRYQELLDELVKDGLVIEYRFIGAYDSRVEGGA